MDPEPPDFLALGPLEVRRAGRTLDLGSRKQRAVLGVLLVSAPAAVSVSRLVDEIWPEAPPSDPVRSLQVYVSALRRALAPHGPRLATGGRAYQLDVPAERFDVARFDAAAAACARHADNGDHEEAVRVADAALGLWRGAAWQDLRAVPGVEPVAARLDEQRVDLMARRIASRMELGQHRDVVPELEQLLAQHPLREDLRGHLMLALHRSGRQPEALAVYSAGRAAKIEETGLEPGSALRDLHADVLRDAPELAVEDAELRRRRHLPAQTTQLIGRRTEVAETRALLAGDCRLLSLCGPGGIGKTRVALQVAHELAATTADGVWFVGLAGISEPALVPQVIAESLGVEAASGDHLEEIREHLASRRLLLLLDNFEQLLEAAHVVSGLLEAAPDLHVLVTSRAPLRLYGERVHLLDPLAADDAVPLFRDRARRADHRFDDSREDVVRRVCDALDRLPLAIELAAARAGELTLVEMQDQLESRLDLASAGPRDRSSRQQTLRGAIRWSVDLLAPEDAEAFGRLAVFVGGCEAEAAEAVGVTPGQLERLVAANLLGRSGGRFEMLETVLEAAVEMLDASGSAAPVRDTHAAYFAELGSAAADGMRGPASSDWLARLTLERGNLRVALAHLEATAGRDSPPGSRLVELAADLSLFWYRTSPGSADVGWLERALADGPDASALLRGRAWHGLAICRGEQGLTEAARAASVESNRLFRRAGDQRWLARALNTLGGITRDLARFDEARPILEESVELRRRLADPSLPLGIALGNQAILALDRGETGVARACLDECLSHGEDDPERPRAQAVLADVLLEDGDLDGAKALLRTAVPALQRLGMTYRLLECLETYAALAVRCGLPAEAATLVAAVDRALAADSAVQAPADGLLRERRSGRAIAALDPDVRAAAEMAGAELDLDGALQRAAELLL